MPPPGHPPQTPRWISFLLSWKGVVISLLATSQFVSFYILSSITYNKNYPSGYGEKPQLPMEGDGDRSCPQDCFEHKGYPWTVFRKPPDPIFSVHSVAHKEKSANAEMCVPQNISPGECSSQGITRPGHLTRETCSFDIVTSDVIFGVWHSLETEERLAPLLETWGANANIVLLASTLGVRESKLFHPGVSESGPHLMDTGILEDDYFSTLGKAFVGLGLMLEAYPSAKWFVVLGDDNYVIVENYINALSAFNPDEPLALSRMVHRNKFGCKVAGGASVITSRALTEKLAPHLRPWYDDILERSGGNAKKAPEEDKFHDIAFQRLVEHLGYSWLHLDELPHEPPGYYFDPRLGKQRQHGLVLPTRSALFHYVPGRYMYYLHFVSSQACTCAFVPGGMDTALGEVAVGVYSTTRRLSKLDDRHIAATWGRELPTYRRLEASGRDTAGLKGDVDRLRELVDAFPEAGWFLLLPVEHYVVPANLALRIQKLDARKGGRRVMLSGPGGRLAEDGLSFVEFEEGALLVGHDLAVDILSFGNSLAGGVFPLGQRPGDREIFAWARTLSRLTAIQDPGLVRRLPAVGEEGVIGCPATFPLDPDLADLKPEFTISEEESVIHTTKFLLGAVPDRQCFTKEL